MKKICLVVGTRPEAIKMAPLYRELKGNSRLQVSLVSTGQHKEMLLQTLGSFGLKPDLDLALMQPNQTLASLTARAISALHDCFETTRPDIVLVQGDTTSVLAAGIAAFYHKISLGHVEAGLRTGDLYSPFPEEMNRRLTSPLCAYNFAPTDWSKANLLREGIKAESVYVTGNTVIDALHWMDEILSERAEPTADIAKRLGISRGFHDQYLSNDGLRFVLVTAHRRESHGAGMENLCIAIKRLAKSYPDLGILFPVHWNPNVRGIVMKELANQDRIVLIDPVGYEDFVWLMRRSYMIISDSGGIQEEAPSFGKPVLVTRETTERPEGVEAGTCTLVGTKVDAILHEASLLLGDETCYRLRSQLNNPYGDGTASKRICRILSKEIDP